MQKQRLNVNVKFIIIFGTYNHGVFYKDVDVHYVGKKEYELLILLLNMIFLKK